MTKPFFPLMVLLISVFASSCMCTSDVDGIGKTKAELHGQSLRRDDEGTLVCETRLIRRPLNNRDDTSDLGSRYLILNASYVETALRRGIYQRDDVVEKDGKKYLRIWAWASMYPQDDSEARTLRNWYLYPTPGFASQDQGPPIAILFGHQRTGPTFVCRWVLHLCASNHC